MEKERVTITLSPGILEDVDAFIDGNTIRNRSHAIETLLSQSLGNTVRDALVLTAGGGAERAMKQIKGRPLLTRTVDWLKRNGIQRITFVVDSGDPRVRGYFGDGIGFRAFYTEVEKALGTGGALALAMPRFQSTFIVCYGDIIAHFDLRSMIEAHRQQKATVTLALASVQRTEGEGIAVMDGARVTGFTKNPKDATSHLANAGIYVMEPEVFSFCEPKCSIERDVLPPLIKQGKCFGYPFSGPWADIARVRSWEKLDELLK